METKRVNRAALARRGRRLEWFTIGWNCLEGLTGVIAGASAGSVSLLGFGVDSFIEVVSGAALLWRMGVDANVEERERHENLTLRIVGACFVALAIYIATCAALSLVDKELPEHSPIGMALACTSLVVMPLLGRAKRRVGTGLKSEAMKADAKQNDFCAFLAAILLAGLTLNVLFELWWADPVAAIIMAPVIANEGIKGLKGGKHCEDCH